MNYDEEAVMVIVGNGPFLGGMKSLLPHASIEDGKFDVLIMKNTKIQQVWTWLETKLQDDYPEDQENLIYFRTDRLQMETDPIVQVDCDGEPLGTTPAEITVLSKHLRVVVGEDTHME